MRLSLADQSREADSRGTCSTAIFPWRCATSGPATVAQVHVHVFLIVPRLDSVLKSVFNGEAGLLRTSLDVALSNVPRLLIMSEPTRISPSRGRGCLSDVVLRLPKEARNSPASRLPDIPPWPPATTSVGLRKRALRRSCLD